MNGLGLIGFFWQLLREYGGITQLRSFVSTLLIQRVLSLHFEIAFSFRIELKSNNRVLKCKKKHSKNEDLPITPAVPLH